MATNSSSSVPRGCETELFDARPTRRYLKSGASWSAQPAFCDGTSAGGSGPQGNRCAHWCAAQPTGRRTGRGGPREAERHDLHDSRAPALGFDAPNAQARIYGSGTNPISWISLGDVAQFVVLALNHPAARNAILELGGPAAISPLEVVRAFEQTGGRPFTVEHVPEEALRAQDYPSSRM